MTKAKLHETVLELCATHKANEKLTAALSELTKPKVGGSSDVTDYTVFDAEGNALYIFCTFHKTWEPVVAEDEDGDKFSLFVEDAKSKNGFRRYCDAGDKQWKEAAKIFTQSKAAIMTDLLDEKLTGADAKAAIDALQAARDIHSPREDGLGTVERPEV